MGYNSVVDNVGLFSSI